MHPVDADHQDATYLVVIAVNEVWAEQHGCQTQEYGSTSLSSFHVVFVPSFTFRSVRVRAFALSEQDKYMLTLCVLEMFSLDSATGEVGLTGAYLAALCR